jgi:chromosome segregation ATPase
MMAFSEKEARLLQAAAEDHEHEMRQLRHAQELQVQSLQHSFAEEREAADKARQQLHQLLEDANARADEAERESYETKQYQEKSRTQQEQQEVRALRRAEDKLVQALAQLDERDESIRTLKTSLAEMKSAADEQQHASQEAEEELEELHEENENMRHHVSTMESEMKVLREKVANLQSDADSLSHVKVSPKARKRLPAIRVRFSHIFCISMNRWSCECSKRIETVTVPRTNQWRLMRSQVRHNSRQNETQPRQKRET